MHFACCVRRSYKTCSSCFPGTSLARNVVQALGAALSDARENIEDAAPVLATINLTVKEQSSSTAHTIETGMMKSEGKNVQMILIDFSEPKEDCTLKSSSTTITF